MIFELKIFFLRNVKLLEYRIKVFRNNLAVTQAFQEREKVPYEKIAILFLVLSAVVGIIVWAGSRTYNPGESSPQVTTILKPDDRPALEKLPTPSVINIEKEKKHKTEKETNYIVVVNKLKKLLLVLDENFIIRQSFPILLGERQGYKTREGDLKTPAGVYKIIEIKEKSELLPMYGPYAFVLNYPNKIDIKAGRTGSGIWIHGTGNLTRTQVTKGCVVVDDEIILKLTEYIQKNTEIYIYPDEYDVPVQGNRIPKKVISASFLYELINNRMG